MLFLHCFKFDQKFSCNDSFFQVFIRSPCFLKVSKFLFDFSLLFHINMRFIKSVY